MTSARVPLGFLAGLAFLAAIALAPARLGAQAVAVDYVEGSAFQRSGDSWAALSVGDKVPPNGTIRLAERSLVQLGAAGAAITLSQPGTYVLKDLLAARASLRAAGAAQAVAVAFSRILQGSEKRVDAVGGARAEVSEPDKVQPGDSSPRTDVEKARDLIAYGHYSDAIDQLADADSAEARFYRATARSLLGDARSALTELSGTFPQAADEWAPDFILLRAKLLVDTFAFSQAAELLVKAGRTLAADKERAPACFFLLALAYRGSGDAAREKVCLDKVVSLAGDTDLGVTAAQMKETP